MIEQFGDKVNELINEIEERQKQKGIKKYGDNDIRSRRNKQECLIDMLEELQDAVNYGKTAEVHASYISDIKNMITNLAVLYVVNEEDKK